jgi:hypothetical protein
MRTTRIARTTAVAVVAVGAVLLAGPADAATAPTVVTVHADQAMATVGSTPVGTNDWDSDYWGLRPAVNQQLSSAGVRVRELNTGPFDDVYRWRTNTDDTDPITVKDGPDQPIPWQQWVGQTKAIGDEPMIHVNYGSTATDGPGGTDIGPQEAAAWVRQANIVDHDNIKYWAIGEEVWGNGYLSGGQYPATEPDHHADKSPTAYGENVVKFAQAMKAVDPTIKIGVEILPFPAGGSSGIPDWNGPLFKAAGTAIDFVDLHWYNFSFGTTPTDANLFATSRSVPQMASTVRSSLAANDPVAANKVALVIGETNSNAVAPGVQSVTTPNALFAADDISTWLENGASNVDWFNTHIGAVADAPGAPDDPNGTGYGDWGLFSKGPANCITNAVGAKICEPPIDTPFPAYYGLELATKLAQPGARFVQTSGDTTTIVTHAAVQPNGDLVVLVENQDQNTSQDVQLDYAGYRALPVATTLSYGKGSTGLAPSLSASGCVHLAPYSMTELVLRRI